MNAKKIEQTVEQTAAFLAGLKSQQGQHRLTVQTADVRRRKYALKAAQGDKEAKAALDQIVADEATATTAMKNLTLAIEAATQEHEQAWARKRAADEREKQERQDALADEVIADDVAIIGDFQNLLRRLERRAANIDEISRLGALSTFNLNLLNRDIDAAILGGLGRFAPQRVFPAGPEELRDLLTFDCARLGKPDPLPPRKPTAVEAALQRSTEPSRFTGRDRTHARLAGTKNG